MEKAIELVMGFYGATREEVIECYMDEVLAYVHLMGYNTSEVEKKEKEAQKETK